MKSVSFLRSYVSLLPGTEVSKEVAIDKALRIAQITVHVYGHLETGMML
jgi:hypothetical protein